MNLILAVPFEVRLAILFVAGVCLGGLANLGAYQLAWNRRAISPWSPPDAKAPHRRWCDRLPIVGWFGLVRESSIHGRGFWVRPILVEILCGTALAALYWWEIDQAGLEPIGVPVASAAVLHARFLCHAGLMLLMLIGSLIDIDDQIIPDTITLPGTLAGLLAAAFLPWSLLPDQVRLANAGFPVPLFAPPVQPMPDFLRLTSPNAWPDALGGAPHFWSLALGLGCWWLWCVAIMPRTWYARHGWRRATQLLCARLRRKRSTRWILLMGAIGSVGLSLVWWSGGLRWEGLLSALVGMAASGGMVWVIRIVASSALRREAMGFGDVTLMAMIGAFLGWQPCLFVFFLAPFAGLLVGIPSVILRRGPEIPYGPFLCLAAVVTIVRWPSLWDCWAPYFGLGLLVPVILLACLIFVVPLLLLLRLLRTAFGG